MARQSRCRVLYLIGQLRSGGSEQQLYYLLREMDRRENGPAVAVWNWSEGEPYLNQIQDLRVPIYSFRNVSSAGAKISRLRKLVRSLRPEIVHSFSFYLNFAAHYSTTGTTVVGLGSMRSVLEPDKKINGWMLGRLSARWPRTQIYNSHAAARLANESRGPFVPARVFVVQNGVDLERFSATPLPMHRSSRVVVGIGSLFHVKRWDRLLKAAADLKRRNLRCSVEIVGDGPLRGPLQAAAHALGVSDCVSFTGHSDQIPARLAAASFLAHPSDVEGCPNAVMEAMACARAVVATAVGDTPRLVEDGRTGFLVPCGNDELFVERMVTLLKNPELCRRMGEAARSKAERELGLNRMVATTLAAYRAAAKPSRTY